MPTTAPVEPFSLAGMGEMLRDTNPDLAAKTGVDEVEPPKIEPSPDPADTLPEDDKEPQPDGKAGDDAPAKDEGETGTVTAAEMEAEQARQKAESDEEAAKTKAEEQKAADEAESAKKAASATKSAEVDTQKTPEQLAQEARDADLKDQLGPHTHPKTRKLMNAKNALIKAARDERDRIVTEREQLKKERDELAERVKSTPVPKEIEDEVKSLRERVRELDITKDPALEAKYDKPIAANAKSAIDLLKSFGADQVIDPNDDKKTTADPRFEANLLKSGLTFKTLQPFIEKLEKGGFVDEAEQLREVVRENGRLAKAKAQEIESWKIDYDSRKQARTQQSQQQTEAESKAIHAEAETTLKTDLAELSKQLPFLNPPPAPSATDSETVRKAKQTALDEYNAAAKSVEQAVATFNPTGMPPEKARVAIAKLHATAVQGVILKQHAIPRLQRDMAAKDARIKDLETQLGKLKGATNLSRQHATLASAPSAAEAQIPAGAATPDAFAAFAKAAGVNIGS